MSDELDIPQPTYRAQRARHGMDPATRRLAIIAGGLGGALLLLVGGWSLLGHRSSAVPVIQAASGPMRVKPTNPGGMQVAGTRDEILADGTDNAASTLAPASEAPAPQDLKAAAAGTNAAPAGQAPTAQTTQAQTTPAQITPAQTAVAASPVKPGAPTRIGSAAGDHPASRAVSGGRNTLVQLAALGSEDAARTEWQRLEKRMPTLLASRQPALSRIDHDGKTFWRLRTGGFADIAQATAFCEQVRARGNGCSIADF